MSDNLDLSPDAELGHALASLRGLTRIGQVQNREHLVPGIFFSIDPQSDNRVEVDCRPGELMAMRMVVDQPGRWLTLNMRVGGVDLTRAGIVGFACKSDAPVTTTCRVCLRSGMAEGHHDAFFTKTLVSFPRTALHLDVLDLQARPDIPRQAPWREFVVFFEINSQEINLRDLRLFII